MNAVELAYIAGFFDGEGCIHVGQIRIKGEVRNYELQVSIGNTDPSVLIWIQEQYHGFISYRKNSKKGRCFGTWHIRANDAAIFLEHIRPYVQIKRRQIDLAINFQYNKKRTGQSLSEKELAWRDEQKKLISELNHRSKIKPYKELVKPIVRELSGIYFEKPLPPRGLKKEIKQVEELYGKEKIKNFSLRMPMDLRIRLQDLANREKVTPAYLVRLAIIKLLKEDKELQSKKLNDLLIEEDQSKETKP